MDQYLKANKQIIREFMRDQYTDERLAMLLAHAQSGKLNFRSCCCFIGVTTAIHALESRTTADLYAMGRDDWQHLHIAHQKPHAREAEEAYFRLGEGNSQRRRRLAPMIKAEIRRRDRERQAIHAEVAAVCVKV